MSSKEENREVQDLKASGLPFPLAPPRTTTNSTFSADTGSITPVSTPEPDDSLVIPPLQPSSSASPSDSSLESLAALCNELRALQVECDHIKKQIRIIPHISQNIGNRQSQCDSRVDVLESDLSHVKTTITQHESDFSLAKNLSLKFDQIDTDAITNMNNKLSLLDHTKMGEIHDTLSKIDLDEVRDMSSKIVKNNSHLAYLQKQVDPLVECTTDTKNRLESVSTNVDGLRHEVNQKSRELHEYHRDFLEYKKLSSAASHISGSGFSSSQWSKVEETYPLLRSTTKDGNSGKFLKNLKDINLSDDSVASLKVFYDKINLVFGSTLSTMPLLPDFDTIDKTIRPIDILLPRDKSNTLLGRIEQGYRTQANALATHLKSDNVISQENAPRAYEKLLTSSILSSDGFELLWEIIVHLTPFLGGFQTKSLHDQVLAFKVESGESLFEFNIRSQRLMQEIITSRDQSGQRVKLKGKVLELLWQDPNIKLSINTLYKAWVRHRRLYQNSLHLLSFNTSLSTIFDTITDYDDVDNSYIIRVSSSSDTALVAGINTPSGVCPVNNAVSLASNKNDQRSGSQESTNNKQRHHRTPWSKSPCSCCGLTNSDVVRLLYLHDGTVENCIFRDPRFLPHKNARESIIQCNAKNPVDKVDFSQRKDIT